MKHSNGLFVLLLMLLLTAGSAFALSVQPDRIEARLEPGQKAVGVHRVMNNSTTPVIVKVSAIDWRKSLFEQQHNVDVSDWLTLPATEFSLEKGQYKDVNFYVLLPADFIGEKVAQMFFEAIPQGEGAQAIRSKLGVIVYAIAKGTERVSAQMTYAHVTYIPSVKTKTGEMPLYNLLYKIYNKGNVHIRPYGTIAIYKNWRKEPEDTVRIEPNMGVYPGQTKEYYFQRKAKKLAPGKYYAVFTMNIGDLYEQKKVIKKKFRFEVKASTEQVDT